MIPKVIHYCWLSGDDFPADIQECIDSWKHILPDYEFVCWDTNRFDLNSNKWVKQAFETKKYAFAADYIRLYALYNYGGIYLDSDVLVYKSFDDLLELPYFIGEDVVHCFEPAIIGAEKHTPWLKDVLDRYDGLEFINSDGSYNMKGLPVVFHERLTPKYNFVLVKSIKDFCVLGATLNIFPHTWFNSRNYLKSVKRKEAYCTHRFVGSWLKKKERWNWKKYVPDVILKYLFGFLFHFVYRVNLKKSQINF